MFSVLGSMELDAVLQLGSQESGAAGENPLPRPAGQAFYLLPLSFAVLV